jgi:large subunit ribosomal protein L18
MSAATNMPELKERIKYGGNVKAAEALGEFLARKALEKGIKKVVFDRSGYKYHGKVKALAEAAVKGGISFKND